ncbi:hypothetical protein OF83DRAFT_1084639 [Amylostereum chailletii]|nr:hypothetical protein OF83DRAFT_1084639 [Amylostereum chailletii]
MTSFSIALGGGSIIRKTASGLTIGPDSVGHRIQEQALVFGGEVPTTTDYTVASYGLKTIGDASKVEGAFPDLVEYQTLVKHMLEDIVDKMKTSAEDIPVLLVGGGAIIAPEALAGASKVIKPEYAGVANAIGAAMARVSGAVDTVVSTAGKNLASVFEEISKMAIDRAVANGAARETVHIAERDAFPLPYIANKSRVIVKAVGDLDFTKVQTALPPDADDLSISEVPDKRPLPEPTQPSTIDIKTYRPKVLNREWFISELDLTWIACGCYILGTGGGGSPYPEFIEVREMMRTGAVVRVIDPQDLADDAVVACGGSMTILVTPHTGMKGSPTVSMEKLPGPEIMEAQNALYGYLGIKADAVMALEIGGGNGLQGRRICLLIGASTNMNVTPVVYEDGPLFLPQVIADGNGNQMMFLKATSEEMMERAFRAALAEMGSSVACARGPYPGHKTKKQIVAHTVSLAWRIGRAVALCRQSGGLDAVAEAIVDEVGGRAAAKVLFKGKIVGVERRLFKGHSYGELIIEAADVAGTGEAPFRGRMRIPFKNENIYATVEVDGEEEEVVASVPDLNGEALGTPEYRYGLFVVVIGITASPHWTSTERGLALGGPRAFDMDVVYKPLGVFSQPRSVVEEFS